MLRTYRPVAGSAYFTALGAVTGYVLANTYVFLWFGGSPDRIDFLFLGRSVAVIYERAPLEFWTAAAIVATFVLIPLVAPFVVKTARRARVSRFRTERGGAALDAGQRTVAGGVALALFGAAIGYVVASAYITYRLGRSLESIDFLFLARNAVALYEQAPREFWTVAVIIGGFIVVPLGLMTTLSINEKLTTYGTTHWQTQSEMKKNGFLAEPGHGFILGKLGDPGTWAPYIVSRIFPHALMIAPTGRGKGVGFVIPNLLMFLGSIVVLDVKGELFRETSRRRLAMKDRVIRFAPMDWSGRSHRYNPLQRIYELKNPDEQWMELDQTARLFLQSSESTEGLLDGGIELFVACGMLAFEQGTPTLGAIYDLATAGGDKRTAYKKLASRVNYPPARQSFTNLGSINDKTLTSYLSLLMTSGLRLWANPAVKRLTSRSDFSFRDIRRKPHAIYFEVPPTEIKTVAALARLFFSDLIASLESHEPGPDEPGKVMIVLDEFHKLGKMTIVADSITTLRGYGGHLAIITQSVPQLEEIYGKNIRLALQAGGGVKVYFTPSDEVTVSEVSALLGKTTRRVISKSRPLGMSPLRSRTVSERTEEAPLMSEDEVRRMNLADVIISLDGQMPIRAKRLVYHEDPVLSAIHEAQAGELPYPPAIENPKAGQAAAADPAVVEELTPAEGDAQTAPGARVDVATSPTPQVRLEASERRAVLTRARAAVFVQPLEAIVKPEHLPAIRAAMRKVQVLGAAPQAVRRGPASPVAREPVKPETLTPSTRRAAIGRAKPIMPVELVSVGEGPEHEAMIRSANAQAIRMRDVVPDRPPEPLD
jgi:type IV secretion system protein VirD4